jgi:hypothetical protein
MGDPRRTVPESELDRVEDQDARDNYRVVLRFRDGLLGEGTVEGFYANLFKRGVDIPPLFIEQLTHVILRNILDGCGDPLRLRAAELFFREQKATLRDGHVLLADLETVEMHASGNRYGSIGRLIVEAQGDLAKTELDVLDRANAELYWQRESRYDTVVSLTYGRPALDAFCRAMEAWVAHFLKVQTKQDRGSALGVAHRPRRRVHGDPERALGGQRGRAGAHAPHRGAVLAAVRRSGGDARRHRRPHGLPCPVLGRARRGEDEAAEPAHQPAAE